MTYKTDQQQEFIEDEGIPYPDQHGFRPKLSWKSQRLELISDISAKLDDGQEVDASVLNFSKAFDRVNHPTLLMDVSIQVVRWTTSCHSKRTHVSSTGGGRL